jgi:hypothetical protein
MQCTLASHKITTSLPVSFLGGAVDNCPGYRIYRTMPLILLPNDLKTAVRVAISRDLAEGHRRVQL